MKIEILKFAKNDLIDGYNFYEIQQKELGIYFFDSLSADIESLQLFAGIHPVYFGKYYRLLSKNFPFAIYYLIENNVIKIYAIVDCRRNPTWIREKLQ